jgi:flagellar protein FliO/FliZ
VNSIRRHHWVVLLVLLAAFVLVANAVAVENIDDLNQELSKQQPSNPGSSNLVWNFIKMVIALGLLIGAAWSIIRLFGRQAAIKMQGNWLHLVDEVMLGQNRGLVLCEIAGKIYALGVTDHNINLLFEINDPLLVKEISQTNLDEAIQKQESWPDLIKRAREILHLEKRPPVEKNFHILMQEQSQKLHNLSEQEIMRVINEKRSGADE